ncbi:orotidine-5'-phosphate decarboxylase [Halanaerobium salsuginis]|jgi:orotidine-5'-phosphate decarboxylase|uniref:Orotidine 5'-phosphate decarboxylase n=1 Tax=Halanaerobium salsuginis TaxID=29563 RepID=A0A1I4JND4_9FIRM|nr:orotidine-5'-phosphate decarboxylase [Halanaerobium salsuginis]SFL68059.1 orotidine-5'-phosphate decarboxylase [Halanaerobium salsuginis]
MKLFIDQLQEKMIAKNSRICVGLDPHLELLPETVLDPELLQDQAANQVEIAAAVLKFNQDILAAVADFTAVVKPQIAFYEKLGSAGFKVLKKLIKKAQTEGLLVLLDAKRNDIGSTAAAYAEAYFAKETAADAITINPYLGRDGILPFLKNKNKGAFALLRTSNPSAVDLQDLKLANGKLFYQAVGDFLAELGEPYLGECGYSNLAAVVGATYPAELAAIRKQLPQTFFLIPGYGAQGGGALDIKAGFDSQGQGAIINSSRGINFAYRAAAYKNYGAENYAEAARAAAREMRTEINAVLSLK